MRFWSMLQYGWMFKCYASEIRQAQKGNYPRIPLTCGMNRQIHKTESRLEVTRDFRKRKWNLLFMGKVSSELLKKNCGNGQRWWLHNTVCDWNQATLPLKTLGKSRFLSSSSFSWLLASFCLWPQRSSVCLGGYSILMPMNCTLENGMFYVICVLPQYLKNPYWKQKQTKTM